jgi:hypothetical protein
MTGLPAVRFGLAQCALVAVLLASAAVRLGEVSTLAAVCLVTSAAALVLPARWAALLGLVAWACFTGFVANQLGQLTFTGPDLARLVLLLTVGSTAHWVLWDGAER